MRALKWITATMAIAGVLLIGVTAYHLIDPFAARREHALQQQLQRQWDTSRPPAGHLRRGPDPVHLVTGQPFALLRIPAFGHGWQFAVVEGTDLAQLATGPGHVIGTALPGRAGNFAVAAHDITAGNPFLHLGDLRRGDEIVVLTRDWRYTYTVTDNRHVRYTDVAVLSHKPGQHLITLITCYPVTLAFTPVRIVVHGTLAGVQPRAPLR